MSSVILGVYGPCIDCKGAIDQRWHDQCDSGRCESCEHNHTADVLSAHELWAKSCCDQETIDALAMAIEACRDRAASPRYLVPGLYQVRADGTIQILGRHAPHQRKPECDRKCWVRNAAQCTSVTTEIEDLDRDFDDRVEELNHGCSRCGRLECNHEEK